MTSSTGRDPRSQNLTISGKGTASVPEAEYSSVADAAPAHSPMSNTTALYANNSRDSRSTELLQLINFPVSPLRRFSLGFIHDEFPSKQIGSNDTIARTATINAALPFLSVQLSPEIQKRIGMQWSTTFVRCSFDRSDCLFEE